MKILVTGGKGFLGSAITKKLINDGHEVETLSRSISRIKDYNIKHHQIDISKKTSTNINFKGIDCIFHVAAKAGIEGSFRDYYTINYLGTKHILDIAKNSGIKYFIYTSSPSVVFTGKPIIGGTENMSLVSNRLSSYSFTKALAEQAVLDSNNNSQLSTISLRPHLIWGRNDPHLLPKVITRHKKGKLKIVGDGKNQVDLTHIDNVVHAHILAFYALTSGKPLGGKSYFISQNEPVILWEWLNYIFESLKLEPLHNKISFPKAYFAGAVLEIFWKIFNLKADLPMSRFVACQLAHDHWFSTKAAKTDFDYEPIISMNEAMEKTIPWLKSL